MEPEETFDERTEDEIRRSVYGKSLPEMHIGDYDRSITRPTTSFARKCVIWSHDRKIYETASRKRLSEFSSNPYFRFEYPEIPRHWPGTWSVITDSELKGVVGRLSRPSTAASTRSNTATFSGTSSTRSNTTSPRTSTPRKRTNTAPPASMRRMVRERYKPQRPPSRPLRLPTVIQFIQIKYSCTERDNVASGKEPDGAAFAVYHQGEVVIDLWGGYADKDAERPWKKYTMTLAFSSSKGIGAIVVASLVERGFLDYKEPVYKYWPEFAQNNKENITVEMLLSHQSGLVLLDSPLVLRDLRDNKETVEKVLAEQGTVWPAGSKFGYHGVTYGLYLDKLVEKVDPAGRSTQQVFLEDLAKPYDLDMYMNSPPDQWHRVARLHNTPRWKLLLEAMTSSRYFPILGYLILFPDSLLANVAKAIKEYTMEMSIFNNPELREITISSASVTATARGMAKLYGILGNGGAIQGKQLISEKVLQKLQTPLVSGFDAVTQTPDVKFGPGTSIKQGPKGQITFGHTGHGGQVGLADPSNQLGYAYLTNYITMYGMGDDPRYLDLEKALYECLDNYLAQK